MPSHRTARGVAPATSPPRPIAPPAIPSPSMGPHRHALALVALSACTDAATPAPAAEAGPVLPALPADPGEPAGCPDAPPAVGAARALHLRCATQRASGPLAMGRLGDIILENAVARFILRSGDESATTIGAPGGGIVDATPGNTITPDLVKEILPTLNLFGLTVGPLVVVRASGREAVVRASFIPRPLELIQAVIPLALQRPALRGVVEYALSADDPALRVRICAIPEGETGTTTVSAGAVAILGGAGEIVVPGGAVLEGDMATAVGRALLAESPDTAVGVALDAPATVIHAGTVSLLNASARINFAGDTLRCTTLRVATAATAAAAYDALALDDGAPMVDVAVPAGGRAELSNDAGRIVLRSRGVDGRVRARLRMDAARTRVARGGGAFGAPDAIPGVGTLRVAASVRDVPGAPIRITAVRDGEAFERRWVVTGPDARALPVGRYRVSASRGMEHSAVSSDITVTANEEARFDAVLERVVATPGYVATDFHLHTELSTDSTHPVGDAVRQMAGEGLELVAGTDHDFITDLDAVATSEGVRDWLELVPGEEVSTVRLGHYGAYPLRRDEARAGANAVPWFGLSPSQIAQAARARGDDVVVQVNHPRLRGTGVFDQIGLDAATGIAHGDPTRVGLPAGTDLTPLDFDVVEVWNGYTRGDNERSFADWLALRAAGRRFVMVGNSDSHRPDRAPGAPRSFVRVPDDGRGRVTWADVRAGLRSGDVSVGAGLYVEADVDGVRPGGRAKARGGRVMLHVRVQAPAWADCTRLRVYRGTEVVLDRAVTTPSDRVVRLDEVVAVDVPAASFLVVRADGTRDAAPLFDYPPFGLTNAIDVGP